MQISPWRLTSVLTANPYWGERLNSSAEFNPNYKHVNTARKQASLQTTSRPHHHATLQQKIAVYKKYLSEAQNRIPAPILHIIHVYKAY
jgi:hypothetical protein